MRLAGRMLLGTLSSHYRHVDNSYVGFHRPVLDHYRRVDNRLVFTGLSFMSCRAFSCSKQKHNNWKNSKENRTFVWLPHKGIYGFCESNSTGPTG